MERDAELAAKTGQPIRADPQRARPIVATGGFRDLFEALKKGVPTASFSPPVVRVCNVCIRSVDRAPNHLTVRLGVVRKDELGYELSWHNGRYHLGGTR
jgi:hypothetical protein